MRERQSDAGLGTVDPREVARFAAQAGTWWDETGSMRMLHRLNPLRIGYIRDQAAAHFGRDPKRLDSLAALRILDIGCGGGLLCEPMARLGAEVVGADASETNIEVAKIHAADSAVSIDYRATTAEALADAGEKFDVVLNMEVIEHVSDPQLYISKCSELVKPDGIMFVATLNRTLKALGLAIVGAEYILGWLPRGTHQYSKFIRPDELEQLLANADMSIIDRTGVIYNPLADRWQRSSDTDVNYMVMVEKRRA